MQELDILEPCIFCRAERIKVGESFCSIHLKEKITEAIMKSKV